MSRNFSIEKIKLQQRDLLFYNVQKLKKINGSLQIQKRKDYIWSQEKDSPPNTE